MWFSLFSYGLYKYDGINWEHIYPADPDLSAVGSWANFVDEFGNIWVGYNNGFIGIYNENGIVSSVEYSENNEVQKSYLLKTKLSQSIQPGNINILYHLSGWACRTYSF
jgi:hypothetical protein